MFLAPATPPPIQSWADAEHGWKAAGPGIEATDDGGKRWHVVFRFGPHGADVIRSLLRTSATAGITTLDYGSFATSDGGAHWYLLSNAPDAVVGHGALLLSASGAAVQRAVRWPLRHLRCRGRWFHQVASGFDDFGPKPRNICLGGPGVDLPMRSVFRLPVNHGEWETFGPALLPGGLVAGVYDTSSEPYTFVGELVYRNGVGAIHDLAGADFAHPFVDWPQIALVGGAVTWVSPDGGATWTSSR